MSMNFKKQIAMGSPLDAAIFFLLCAASLKRLENTDVDTQLVKAFQA